MSHEMQRSAPVPPAAANGVVPPSPLDGERLFARARDLICLVGVDGYFRRVNPAFERTLGWTVDELLARPFLDFIHPDDRAAVRESFEGLRDLAADTATEQHENRCLRRDGSFRWLSWHVSPPDADGIIDAVGHDVTEQRAAHAALRASDARHRTLLDTLPLIVFEVEPEPPYAPRYFSSSVEALGYTREEWLTIPELWVRSLHPDDRARVLATNADALVAGRSVSYEYRLLARDGTARWIDMRGDLVLDAEGRPAAWRGIGLDITDRRRAEAALRQSEERYRLATRATDDVVFEWDVRADTVHWSDALEAVFGHARASVGRGREWWNAQIHPEDRDAVTVELRAALASATDTWRTEYRLRRGDGSHAHVLVRGFFVRDPDGQAIRMIGAISDQSRRRLLEAQLRTAQKLEAVGRLAGGVAHEFNNLLMVIVSYAAGLAAELPATDDARTDVEEISRAANRAAELTGQLLAFGRQQVLRPQLLDVSQSVATGAETLWRVLGEEITVVTECAPDAAFVLADPGQLEQLLMHLVLNARDAMRTGGTLHLRTAHVIVDAAAAQTRPGLSAGRYVSLVVEDTGTGIDPAILPRIFEPFFTTKPVGQGTGLGLATVYGIAHQSGGSITVESTPGVGSRFTVLLPAAEAPANSSTTIGATTSAVSALPRGSETILLVDDDLAVRTVVRRTLQRLGYTVLEAESGAQALEIAEGLTQAPAGESGRSIDLVLTDIIMPEMNGRVMAEQLTVSWPGLRVLYMSGYPDDEILRRGLLNPGTAFLAKPFTPERLARAARQALDGRGLVQDA